MGQVIGGRRPERRRTPSRYTIRRLIEAASQQLKMRGSRVDAALREYESTCPGACVDPLETVSNGGQEERRPGGKV